MRSCSHGPASVRPAEESYSTRRIEDCDRWNCADDLTWTRLPDSERPPRAPSVCAGRRAVARPDRAPAAGPSGPADSCSNSNNSNQSSISPGVRPIDNGMERGLAPLMRAAGAQNVNGNGHQQRRVRQRRASEGHLDTRTGDRGPSVHNRWITGRPTAVMGRMIRLSAHSLQVCSAQSGPADDKCSTTLSTLPGQVRVIQPTGGSSLCQPNRAKMKATKSAVIRMILKEAHGQRDRAPAGCRRAS